MNKFYQKICSESIKYLSPNKQQQTLFVAQLFSSFSHNYYYFFPPPNKQDEVNRILNHLLNI